MPDVTATYLIGACRVTLGPASVTTQFPDGAVCHATPNRSPEDTARAWSLGYGGDVDRMTAQHDLLHTLLAVAQGKAGSPTLHGVARDRPADPKQARAEEGLVLLVQRLLNVGLGPVLEEYAE